MPTHALLGATGATGSAVLRFLLDEPVKNLKLNIFIRNKAKLFKAFPELQEQPPIQISITEAQTDDIAALKSCLQGVEVIYNCISTNDSAPGISISRDIAKSIIEALQQLKSEQKAAYRPPTIVINRSTTLNQGLRKEQGTFAAVIHFVLGDCYYDIEEGCNMMERAFKDGHLLDYIFADPPSLHESPGTGRTGYKFIFEGVQSPALSYADLGASFVDLGLHKEQYIGKGVGVSATGEVVTNWPLLMSYMARGLRGRILRF